MAYAEDYDDDFFANLPEEEVAEALKPPAPWPEGTYQGTIVEAKHYQGEGKPFPCVQAEVQIANDEGKTKKIRTWILSKNPKAVQGGIRTLVALGIKTREYRNPAQLVGCTAPVVVVSKPGNDGVVRNEIKSFQLPKKK